MRAYWKQVIGITLLLMVISGNSYSQVKDSLLKIINSDIPDSMKVYYYGKLGVALKYEDYPAAISYCNKGVELAKKIKSWNYLGFSYSYIASLEAEQGNYEYALEMVDSAQVYIKPGNKSNLDPMMTRANIYLSLGEYNKATDEYFKLLKLVDESSENTMLFNIYNNLIITLNNTGKFELSLEYCKRALHLAEKLKNDIEIGWACSNFFEIYHQLKQIEEARPYVLKAYEASKFTDDPGLKATAINNMGTLATYDKDFKSSVTYYLKATDLYERMGDRMSLCNSLNNVGYAYMNLKLPAQAQVYLKKALLIGTEIGVPEQIKDSYRLLSESSWQLKNYKAAYDYQMSYKAISDSLLNDKSQQEIAGMEAKYKSEQKQKQIELLNKEKEIQALQVKEQNATISRQKLLRNMLVVISVLVILASFLILRRVKDRQKRDAVEERERISRDLHDQIGSSLGSIANFSELAKMKVGNRIEPSEKMLLEKIESTSRETIESMSDIVWAVNPRYDNLEQLVNRMENSAADMLTAKGMQYDFKADHNIENIKMNMRQRKNIFLVFKEALNNIVKHSDSSKIDITFHVYERKINLSITDNGVGFDPDNYIKTKGNGLYNMKERAKEVNGEVVIHSTINMGTTIHFTFPVNI